MSTYYYYVVYEIKGIEQGCAELTINHPIESIADVDAISSKLKQAGKLSNLPLILNWKLLRIEK
jgi:hypothetical protein